MTDRNDGAEKVRKLIKKTHIAMLSHVDAQGRIISKPMATQDVDFDGTVYFIAERSSDQVRDLEQRPAVNVAYAADDAWVSLTGTARVVNDEAKLKELWDSFTGAWLEGGPENPNNVLIEITGDSAEYWDTPGGGKITQVANLLKTKVTGRTIKGDTGVVEL
ncbi:general stress protein [Kocuria dechangensis]|uniref:General stress protein n=1 Tax=Kocuria dechangensis TaxID=1176249 RepID=A0A917H7C7_9MICC|nr:pyridoxamine 5'-phosphate oxidase family protein [Kocuria dechangensis]GGG69853.1 general stress protein [Kocuria dechangensis]